MDLKPTFEKIQFAQRYRNICDEYSDFENRLRGNKKEIYDLILSKFGYDFKYFKTEFFYRTVSTFQDFELGLQLVLKDGLVEAMIDIKKGANYLSPGGRLDFLPEDLNIPFERKKYNLPIYTSVQELEAILIRIFKIYEDIKEELLKTSDAKAD